MTDKKKEESAAVALLIGFLLTAGLLMVVFRLCGSIDWGWHVVTFPIWVMPLFFVCIVAGGLIVNFMDWICGENT